MTEGATHSSVMTLPEPDAAPEGVEDRLAQAAQVASRLSHDFGNVLTGVLGFTELALGQVTPGTRAHRYLQEVWDAARGGAEWLNKLNYFCRRSPPDFTPTGLPGALAEEQARRGPAAASWQADIPHDLPALACDGESLRRALREVLDNAFESTGGNGPVMLLARVVDLNQEAAHGLMGQPSPGRFVQVSVADRGPGFTEAVRSRLFQDFFYSTKPRHRGMGLMMTYGIVQRFGGGIELGLAEGGGAEVRLYFPAAPDAVAAGPAQLLVIDEDPQVLAEARRILEPAGYRVQVATTPHEGLALYQAQVPSFDLVLLAVHLANSTGPDVLRRLQLRDPHAKCLFLHTPGGAALPRDDLLTPAVMVHKPFAAAVLLQSVVAALRGPTPADPS
jgi:CheY-like chemotaxis protein